ncbi:hypothetical protein CDAR_540621 [Caerostris darwini]|uniref:Uncharacterized protein n=1 Tax=Caerostris darwini TaxID=1538125 RepID=A0AAV4VME8_9ARAC|nr:hypothetical protein CDAR_540621 [Caerostris darwini]
MRCSKSLSDHTSISHRNQSEKIQIIAKCQNIDWDPCRKNSTRTLRETLFFLIITSSRLKGRFSPYLPPPIYEPHHPLASAPAITPAEVLSSMFDVRQRKRRWRIGGEISGCCKIGRLPIGSANSFALKRLW